MLFACVIVLRFTNPVLWLPDDLINERERERERETDRERQRQRQRQTDRQTDKQRT